MMMPSRRQRSCSRRSVAVRRRRWLSVIGSRSACILLLAFSATATAAHADSCSSVLPGAQMGPAPDFNSWPWSNACYISWPGTDSRDYSRNPRLEYERKCKEVPGFIRFEGDFGSNKNTCIFEAPADEPRADRQAPGSSGDQGDQTTPEAIAPRLEPPPSSTEADLAYKDAVADALADNLPVAYSEFEQAGNLYVALVMHRIRPDVDYDGYTAKAGRSNCFQRNILYLQQLRAEPPKFYTRDNLDCGSDNDADLDKFIEKYLIEADQKRKALASNGATCAVGIGRAIRTTCVSPGENCECLPFSNLCPYPITVTYYADGRKSLNIDAFQSDHSACTTHGDSHVAYGHFLPWAGYPKPGQPRPE